jgi:hypothetical protein
VTYKQRKYGRDDNTGTGAEVNGWSKVAGGQSLDDVSYGLEKSAKKAD